MISLSKAKWGVRTYKIEYRQVWIWDVYVDTSDYRIILYCDPVGFKTEAKAFKNWKLFAKVNKIKDWEVME